MQEITQPRRLCFEDEDEEFKEEFHRVIKIEDLKYIDNKNMTMTKA